MWRGDANTARTRNIRTARGERPAQQMPRSATTRGDAAWAAVPHEVRQDARKWFGWQGADGSNPELWLRGSTVKVPPWQCRARLLRLLGGRLAAPDGSRHAGREARPLGAQSLPCRCSSQPPQTPRIPPPLTTQARSEPGRAEPIGACSAWEARLRPATLPLEYVQRVGDDGAQDAL